jgi:hypothetical protein
MSDTVEFLIKALLAEKDELLAELPGASRRRATVIREELAVCDSLIRRAEARRGAG